MYLSSCQLPIVDYFEPERTIVKVFDVEGVVIKQAWNESKKWTH
jgi:hypothetical protein